MSTLSRLSQRSLAVLGVLQDGSAKTVKVIALNLAMSRTAVASSINRFQKADLVKCVQRRCVQIAQEQTYAITEKGLSELRLEGRIDRHVLAERHGGAYTKATVSIPGRGVHPRAEREVYVPPSDGAKRLDADAHYTHKSKGMPC